MFLVCVLVPIKGFGLLVIQLLHLSNLTKAHQ